MADNEQFRNPSPPPDVTRNPSPPPEVEQNVPQEASLNSEEVSSEASKGAVNGTLQNSSSFSNVSSSYQKLQSGIDGIKAKTDVSDAPKQNTEKKVKEDKEFIEIVDDEKPKKEKKSKMRKAESSASSSDDDDGDYEWRKDMLPDRSKSDYYCELCDAHMNSEQMWENHVQGKRHLKNLKKEPGEPPSKVRAVKQDCTPKIQRKIDKVEDPVVGLDYICELQRSEPFLDPTYTCFLCHSTCMASTIVDHILGAKHRLAYLKAVDPDAYALVENMKMKKSGLTALAEERAAELEAKEGRGQMEVKLEKPKLAPPPPKREKRYLDDDRERDYYSPYKRPAGIIDSDFRRDRWSPEPPMPPPPPMNQGFALPANVHSLPMHVKLDLLDQLSTLVVVSDNEAKALMRIINSLTQSLLQFKIRNLPPGLQDMLAKHIISGDTRGLENALGLGNTGMANVGNMLNSMAAAGELPEPRGALGGPPPPWGPGGSGRGRGGMGRGGENVWGSPGRGGFSGGMNPVPFGGPHWHGMGNSGFRSGDRASQGY